MLLSMTRTNRLTDVSIYLSLAATLLLIGLTNPFSGGPMVVVIFLISLFILVFSVTLKLLQLTLSFEKVKYTLSSAGRYYSALVISIGFVFLVGLSTIGQLQFTDALLVLVFEVLANFYIFRRL